MAKNTSTNFLIPAGVMLTVLIVAGASWWLSRDIDVQYGDVGPELSSAPKPKEAEADSTSDTIAAIKGQIDLNNQQNEERVSAAIAANKALQEEVDRLNRERELDKSAQRDAATAELAEQRAQNEALGSKVDELTNALLTRLDNVETRIDEQSLVSMEIPIDDGKEKERVYRSGERIPATELNDIVWLGSIDESVRSGYVTGGGAVNNLGDGIVAQAKDLKTGSLLRASNGTVADDANNSGAREFSQVNPNVRSSLVTAQRDAVQKQRVVEAQELESLVEPEPDSEPVYTIPDLSIGFNSSALTALVGRVYLDEDKITNPFEFKLVLGRNNVAANWQELPSEIQGMFFEGYATGDPLLSCVRGNITAASFLFKDGTIVPAYIGDPGSRPENDVYPANRIGYITDPRGNCIPGQFVTDAPKWLAANTLLAGAEGYARALRQQEIETSTIVDGTGATLIENITGEATRFAGASAAVGGVDVLNEYARERLGQVFEAVYVPPGHPVIVHLQQEIRIDRKKDARKITYPQNTGQSNAYLP